MVSVGNNFFYTKSLPCSLWFFDKGKKEELRGKVLFIDARNYYTVVDRTLNEWSEWQLKNLNAIVWLYRGEVDKYQALVKEYDRALVHHVTLMHANELLPAVHERENFSEVITAFEEYRKRQQELAKVDLEKVVRKDKKKTQALWDEKLAVIDEAIVTAKEAVWLTEKFGEGKYADIPGLCKVATLEEIEAKGYSLTPGAYVGVAPTEDDGVDFHQRMTEIHKELLSLQAESNRLMETISKNWEEMGL